MLIRIKVEINVDSLHQDMCGILFLRVLNKNLPVEKIQAFLEQIYSSVAPRGPECSARINYPENGIYIIFHRLATYGMDMKRDSLPITKGGWNLVCNGDIYNYRDIWDQLSSKPFTRNDCEVIIDLVRAYLTEPKSIPRALRGVFASLVYNHKNHTLVIMRDAFGVRPLFEIRTDDFELWSSDLSVVQYLTKHVNVEVNEYPPGFISVMQCKPFEITRRFVHSHWYEMAPLVKDVPVNDIVFNQYAKQVHDALLDAVRVRVAGMQRPIGCLVSGGLDSSLITGMVYSMLPLDRKLYTYTLGLEGATDTPYADKVIQHLGLTDTHRHIKVSKNDMLEAIDVVIRKIGSYDTTTVRASVGNYLVCKAAKDDKKAIYIFNGDGADEVMGGYLYFHKAPTATEFDIECKRLLVDISKYDVLRSDRSIAGNGLAPRTPFLDTKFVDTYMSIPANVRFEAQKRCEKYLVRLACKDKNYIPNEVLWRTKEAFSDGVSSQEESWYDTIHRFVNGILTEPIESYDVYRRSYNPPKTKEQVFYRMIFEKWFGTSDTVAKTVPYFWMPKFVTGANDASARTLKVYQDRNGKQEMHEGSD